MHPPRAIRFCSSRLAIESFFWKRLAIALLVHSATNKLGIEFIDTK